MFFNGIFILLWYLLQNFLFQLDAIILYKNDIGFYEGNFFREAFGMIPIVTYGIR